MSVKPRRITLTEHDDGHWTARDDPAGRTAEGSTPEEALHALTDTDENNDPGQPTNLGTQEQRETVWDCYG